MRHDSVRNTLGTNHDPRAGRNRSGETGSRNRCRTGSRVCSRRARQLRVARRDHRHVLVHPEVPSELATERGVSQRLAEVADHLSLGEDIQVQQGRFGDRVENQIPTRDRATVLIKNLSKGQDESLGVGGCDAEGGACGIGEELDILTKHDLVDETRLCDDRRTQELIDERLEGLRFLAVTDEEAGMDVLVQSDRHVRGRHVLDDDVIGHVLALCLEFVRARDVHRIAVTGEDVLEIAKNEVAGDHVLNQDCERLIGPQFRNEHVHGVRVDRPETTDQPVCLVEAKHCEFPFSG